METERRRHPRKDVLRTAILFFASGHQCLDCLIWNMSASGAMIEVESEALVASSGRLISETIRLDRPYGVIWRKGRKIGVEFTA